MATYVLQSLIAGMLQPISDTDKGRINSLLIGTSASNTELNKTILDNVVALQNGTDFSTATNAHTHDGRYYTETEIDGFFTTANAAIAANAEDIVNLQTLTGVADGIANLGTFEGSTIPDSSTIKAALQALESAYEGTIPGLVYRGLLVAGSDLTGNVTGNAYVDGGDGFVTGDFFKVSGSGTITVSDGTIEVDSGDMLIINTDIVNDGSITVASIDKIDNTEAQDILREGDLLSGQIFVGNASNVATAVAMSGDATLSNAGVLTIADEAVTQSKIAIGAVDYLQIATGGVRFANLADGAVQTSKISDLNVTDAKIESVSGQKVTLTEVPTNFTPAQVDAEGTDKASAYFKGVDNKFAEVDSALAVSGGKKSVILGESFAPGTWAVRWAKSGETAGRVYKASSSNATADKNFWAFGIVYISSTTAAGATVTATVEGGILDTVSLGWAAADQGLPFYLASNGEIYPYSYVTWTSGDAVFKMGQVVDTTTAMVCGIQQMGVYSA